MFLLNPSASCWLPEERRTCSPTHVYPVVRDYLCLLLKFRAPVLRPLAVVTPRAPITEERSFLLLQVVREYLPLYSSSFGGIGIIAGVPNNPTDIGDFVTFARARVCDPAS